MSDYAIKVENLGKAYTIRHQQPQRYATLRDVMAEGVKNAGRLLLQALPVGRCDGYTAVALEPACIPGGRQLHPERDVHHRDWPGRD